MNKVKDTEEVTLRNAREQEVLREANALARFARSCGYECTVELGDRRHPFKPEVTLEVWRPREEKTS